MWSTLSSAKAVLFTVSVVKFPSLDFLPITISHPTLLDSQIFDIGFGIGWIFGLHMLPFDSLRAV